MRRTIYMCRTGSLPKCTRNHYGNQLKPANFCEEAFIQYYSCRCVKLDGVVILKNRINKRQLYKRDEFVRKSVCMKLKAVEKIKFCWNDLYILQSHRSSQGFKSMQSAIVHENKYQTQLPVHANDIFG